jgi:hypothetical protein
MEAVMVALIHVGEGIPEEYPDPPAGLSTDAAALDGDVIWQRLESYIAWRYSARAVEWIVEGPGDWQAPLRPATITTTEAWRGDAWEAVTLAPSPLGGYVLDGHGPYRFTGAAGVNGADVPASVLEAYKRLAEYLVAANKADIPAGVRSFSEKIPDVIEMSYERSAAWVALAMQHSGAADLLRGYRRV